MSKQATLADGQKFLMPPQDARFYISARGVQVDNFTRRTEYKIAAFCRVTRKRCATFAIAHRDGNIVCYRDHESGELVALSTRGAAFPRRGKMTRLHEPTSREVTQ